MTAPKDRPIIFSAPMVRALLDGRKSQTRRVLKNIPDGATDVKFCHPAPSKPGWQNLRPGIYVEGVQDKWFVGPSKFYIGDRLWVREAWGINHYDYGGTHPIPKSRPADLTDEYLSYLATESDAEIADEMPYRPSIHMPRWASRLTLIVTDVRVQRLQDITKADAIAEGAPDIGFEGRRWVEHSGGEVGYECAGGWFADLWNTINGAKSWDANPWVVAISFKTIRANIDAPEARAA